MKFSLIAHGVMESPLPSVQSSGSGSGDNASASASAAASESAATVAAPASAPPSAAHSTSELNRSSIAVVAPSSTMTTSAAASDAGGCLMAMSLPLSLCPLSMPLCAMPLPSPPGPLEAHGRDGANLIMSPAEPATNMSQQRQQQQQQLQQQLYPQAGSLPPFEITPSASGSPVAMQLTETGSPVVALQRFEIKASPGASPMPMPMLAPPPVRTQSDNNACALDSFLSWSQAAPERESTHAASDSSGTSDPGSAPPSATGGGAANSLSPDPLLELEPGLSELMQPLPAFQDSISKWLERSRSVMAQKAMQQRTTGSIMVSTSAPQGSGSSGGGSVSPNLYSSAVPLTRSITAQLPVSAASFASAYAKHPGTFSQLGFMVSSMTSSSYSATPASASASSSSGAGGAGSSSFSANRKERHHHGALSSSGPSSAAGSASNSTTSTPMHLNSAQIAQQVSSNQRRASGGAGSMVPLSNPQQPQQQHPATSTHKPNPIFRFDAPLQHATLKHAQLPLTTPASTSNSNISGAAMPKAAAASPATTVSGSPIHPPSSPPRRATPPSAQRALTLQRQRSAGAALPSLAESVEPAMMAPLSLLSSSPRVLRRNAAAVPHLQLPVVADRDHSSASSGSGSEDSVVMQVSSPNASPGAAPSKRRTTATHATAGSGTTTPNAHRRSPSAALPAQSHGIPVAMAHAKILAPRLSRSGSSSLRDVHTQHNLHSASPMPSASPGPSAMGGSSSHAPLPSLRADSLEDAWRRKICLNMNLVPESGSSQLRSPLSAKPRSTRAAGVPMPFSILPVSKKCHSQPGTPMIGTLDAPNCGQTGSPELRGMLQFPRPSVSKSGSNGNGKRARGTSGTRTPSNAVLGPGPARSRVHSDSEPSTDQDRPGPHQGQTPQMQLSQSFTQPVSPPEPAKQDTVPPASTRTPSLPSTESYSTSDQQQQQPQPQPVDWSALCHCLTGEDLDLFEQETLMHLKSYYSDAAAASASASAANAVFGDEDASIASLDESIRNMEARKSITLRMRRMGWMVAVGFALAFLGSIGLLLFSGDQPFIPTGAFGYLLGALLFSAFYPWVTRTTRWFKCQPLLPLATLHRTLNVSAGFCAAALFVGALEFHGSRGLHPDAFVSQTEGWSRWVLCSLPLFVGYVLHDVNSVASQIWWGVSMAAIFISHVLNAFWLAAPADDFELLHSDSNALRGRGRSQQWILALAIQLLFCSLNFKVAQAAMVSIQAHRIQLWRREQFMLEQGKHLAQQREAAFSTANQKSQFLAKSANTKHTLHPGLST